MTLEELIRLLSELRALPSETEWVEFESNYVEPEEIGEYLWALANSAGLYKKEAAYLVWGIEDTTYRVIGTDFKPKPRRDKVGNQELESWLALQLHPRIDFKIHEFMIRACYQHACLRYVSNDQMTNTSLRKRFSIEDKNYSVASRIIADTMNAALVKPHEPENASRKHAKYVPFWAWLYMMLVDLILMMIEIVGAKRWKWKGWECAAA